jgi:DNA-binding SARP family transcriptional activator
MSALHIRLFGKLSVRRGDTELPALTQQKAQELFCYLLLHRERPHPRETLAAQFWGDTPTAQSKKYLRHTLWQLQAALAAQSELHTRRTLLVETEWVQLNRAADLWLDVAAFERADAAMQGVSGEALDASAAERLRGALDLYQGDLLDGWYHDWCIYERERLKERYLVMLDKLVAYCEAHGQIETGLRYAALALREDRAREGIHQRVARLHFLGGDRAGALRQIQRCATALHDELGVDPSETTIALEGQIRLGRLNGFAVRPPAAAPAVDLAQRLGDALSNLREARTVVGELQQRLDQQIRLLEQSLESPKRRDDAH